MKHKKLIIVGLIAMFGAISCAKERGPTLKVHVQEKDGTPAVGARVHAWKGGDPCVAPGSCIVNPDMDKTGVTDSGGDVVFDFKFSIVLDVDVTYFKQGVDSLLNPITDTLSGSRVVKIESKRQRDKNNNYNETVEVE